MRLPVAVVTSTLILVLVAHGIRAEEYEVRKDIEFLVVDGVSLKLDAYLLSGGPHPAMVHVHGGGAVSGDKKDTPGQPWFKLLMGHGFSVVSVNYRLAPKYQYPSAPNDVQSAITFIKANAATLRIDPDRLALIGESFGGFLVSHAGAKYLPGNLVSAVVSFYGEHDYALRVTESPCAMDGYTKPLPPGGCISGGMAKFFGFGEIKTATHRSVLRDAACVTHVHRGMPPYLLIHGTRDYGVPIEQAHSMVQAMERVGADVELVPIVGGGHGGWSKPEQQHYKAKLVAWLRERLGGVDRIVRVLIVDGQNNHNWKDTTPFLKKQLEKTGRFEVAVSTTPPENAPDGAFDGWRPDFSSVDVILNNFNNLGGKTSWPKRVRDAIEHFVRDGGALVNVHSANNAHAGWQEFEEMTGLLWRPRDHGSRVYVNSSGTLVSVEKGEGVGAGHGKQHEYVVTIRDSTHPITRGMPTAWMHGFDELYHAQRGPARNLHLLATAFSAEETGGTGVHEPVLWWIPYGQGRVVTTVLGHVSRADSTKLPAMRCLGFLTIVSRACEWAATGKVTIPIPPSDFPTVEEKSLLGF